MSVANGDAQETLAGKKEVTIELFGQETVGVVASVTNTEKPQDALLALMSAAQHSTVVVIPTGKFVPEKLQVTLRGPLT